MNKKCSFLVSRADYEEIRKDWQITGPSNGYFYCQCTMTATGPDDDFVAPEQCNSKRSCYKQQQKILQI